MKKSKLLEIISAIPGDPEMYLWNGYVEDIMPISTEIHEETLYKETKNYIHLWTDRQKQPLSEEAIEKLVKSKRFEYLIYPPEDNMLKYYKAKKCYIIQPKTNDKTYVDRIGKMSY